MRTLFVALAVQRALDPFEDPGKVLDFWGKSRVRERLQLMLATVVTTSFSLLLILLLLPLFLLLLLLLLLFLLLLPSQDQMKFFLRQTVVSTLGDSES